MKYGDIKVVADVTRNPAIANRIQQIDLDFQIALQGDEVKTMIVVVRPRRPSPPS